MKRSLLRNSLFVAASIMAALAAYQQNLIPGLRHIKIITGEHRRYPELDMNLTRAERLENFELLWQAVDRNYSFFAIKNIDWDDVHRHYRPLIEQATGGDFYAVLQSMVNELKDCHSWLSNYSDPKLLNEYAPDIEVRRIQGQAVAAWVADSVAVVSGVHRGSVILDVEGAPVADEIEKLRPRIRPHGSERAFLDTAYRRVLDGDRGTSVTFRFTPPSGGEPREVTLSRNRRRPHRAALGPSFSVQSEKTLWWGMHPSGVGYIRILTFGERMSLADKFDKALAGLRNTKALIVDIRDNPGGYGTAQLRIIGRFLVAPAPGTIFFERNGRAHDAFRQAAETMTPVGPWPYVKPVALLIDAATGSASDLFAAAFISTGRPIIIGSTTHGDVTGSCVEFELPCGLVVRISNGYIADASGKVIEGNGNEPQIKAELTIDDVTNGTDSVIDRATEELLTRADAQRVAAIMAPAVRTAP